MDEAFKQSMQLYSELSASNPDWKKIYDDYAAFRKDQSLWFRFTAMRFHQLMQSQKLSADPSPIKAMLWRGFFSSDINCASEV